MTCLGRYPYSENMINKSVGLQVDEFLDNRTLVEANFKDKANYVECTDCGVIHEVQRTNLSEWRFTLMGLVPSELFKTIRGRCPTCQEMRKKFASIVGEKTR